MKTLARGRTEPERELAEDFAATPHLNGILSPRLSLTTVNEQAPAREEPIAPACSRFSAPFDKSALSIQLVTLDELRCTLNGADTDLPRQKRRFALFVYLAMERSAPREKLTSLFYPETTEERARNRLKFSVFALRKEFGEDCIITSRADELSVHPSLILDARDFGSLAEIGEYGRALDLYKRPFLEGFYIADSVDWERWVDRKRAVLAGTYSRAVRAWVKTLLEQREFDQAIAHTTRWLKLEEQNEEANVLHITALAAAERYIEARHHYDGFERYLREELGTAPSPRMRELKSEVESQAQQSRDKPRIRHDDGQLDQRTPVVEAEPARQPDPPKPGWIRIAKITAAVGLSAIGIAIGVDSIAEFVGTRRANAQLDSTRYMVPKFTYDAAIRTPLYEQQIISGVLRQLDGISVVDQHQIPESEDSNRMSIRSAQAIARKIQAGRFFLGIVQPVSDGLHIEIGLYDTKRGVRLASTHRRITAATAADTALISAVDQILFGPGVVRVRGALLGSRSVPARHAFSRAQEALKAWDLLRADSAFMSALDHDPEFAEASLWLAQVRSWVRTDASEWRISAERAVAARSALSPRDRLLAVALLALAKGDRPTACGLYQTASTTYPSDFVPLFAYAYCLHKDDEVVVDNRSPSGFSFRSGYATAIHNYIRAFQMLPSSHRGLSNDLFSALRKTFLTSESYVRAGRSSMTGERFLAFASWGRGDTLETIPYPERVMAAVDPATGPSTLSTAITRQRRVFLEIARSWVAELPKSPQAYLALGLALDMNGHPGAADTLRYARSITRDASLIQLLGGVEFIIRIKSAVPHDLRMLRDGIRLADSLLQSWPPGYEAHSDLFAALAAARGKASLAADYLERSNHGAPHPPALLPLARRLLAMATLADRDTIDALANQLSQRLALVPTPTREQARSELLIRPSTLAFPRLRADIAVNAETSSDYLYRAQQFILKKDTAAVRTELDRAAAWRRPLPSSAITTEAVYPEASLLVDLGDISGATALLDGFLNELHMVAPDELDSPMRLGALVRTFELRAALATRFGDSKTSQKWSNVVDHLWRSQPTPRFQTRAKPVPITIQK